MQPEQSRRTRRVTAGGIKSCLNQDLPARPLRQAGWQDGGMIRIGEGPKSAFPVSGVMNKGRLRDCKLAEVELGKVRKRRQHEYFKCKRIQII